MFWLLALLLFVLLLLVYCYYDVALKVILPSLEGKHIVVTGGSSGIGKCVALEAAKLGGNVTIIARNSEKLNDAKKEVIKSCRNQKSQIITSISMDVSQPYDLTEKEILSLEETVGPISMLVNCAGSATCATIDKASESNFRKMVDLNLFGTILPTKAVAHHMIKRQSGVIVVTSSLASLLGIFGLGAYCSAKWGLRGFAETLRHEMAPHNVSVTLCLPPDTDTPGFEEENKDKPEETKLICQSGGLATPEEVARKLISDAMRGRFWSTVGLDGNLLSHGSAGFSPYSSYTEVFLQVWLAALVRVLGIFHIDKTTSIISSMKAKRQVEERNKQD